MGRADRRLSRDPTGLLSVIMLGWIQLVIASNLISCEIFTED